ncbi:MULTISPECIES: polysaccharide deacetylase family protein [unclassified Ensifer]|uniref:polysaccharide deacetylase family protein n=1 Tax=unclassified Ensifer TaxID=2633371 RepID=UPI000813C7C2|nr:MULTISPECIES: polysaccharide deacetylase family protein [unclassified Ensifer]OCP10243.1 polysaccharide deacetylase [Ensifer sp. LC13]OCP11239.1 polysaccharide deacetylase [Ensifer sp. LC11]OCP14686.1 polysaccharide deacetylase [Ensifer sp. LC14]OCP33201.1 polysaccharide deacetylase [Ensifer sp. LC499]
MKAFALPLIALAMLAQSANAAPGLVEPDLRLPANPAGKTDAPRVALTLDACSGATDMRILGTLIENRIPATIFVTARWLKRNGLVVEVMKAHPDLFEIEDHGAMHVPPIDVKISVYGLAAAGSEAAVSAEIDGGAKAITQHGLPAPRWFRGATAKYTHSSMSQIRAKGYRIAGYSVNGDGGSLLGAAVAEKRIRNARDGDVIIAHINQPTHAAGAGVARGILDLKAKGYNFVRLNDIPDEMTVGATN